MLLRFFRGRGTATIEDNPKGKGVLILEVRWGGLCCWAQPVRARRQENRDAFFCGLEPVTSAKRSVQPRGLEERILWLPSTELWLPETLTRGLNKTYMG